MVEPVLTRLRISMTAQRPVAWPHFAGSTLRGAFGRALRKAACITGQPICTGCPLRNQCAYGVVFDPPPPAQPLHPSFRDGLPRYLVQPPSIGASQLAEGDRLSFSVVLFPKTETHTAFVQHVIRKAVQEELISPGHFRFCDLHAQTDTLPDLHEPAPPGVTTPNASLTLRFITPMRLQHQGKPLFNPRSLDAVLLVKAMLRRHLQWCQYTEAAVPEHSTYLNSATRCQLDVSNLHWHDMQRHSSLRNEKLPLGGLIGNVLLHGPTAAMAHLAPLIRLAETIHIGKETVMGLGQFQLGKVEPH